MAVEELIGGETPDEAGEGVLGVDIALERVSKSRRGKAGERDEVADALLTKQTAKLDAEMEHMQLRAWNERLTLALRALTATAAVVVIGLFLLMIWNAAHDRSLVIEPFRTTPELAQRGYDGQTLASRVLDHLNEMQSAPEQSQNLVTVRAVAQYSAESGREVKLEIPETGVSISELRRALGEWLGHQQHISGSVVRDGDNLSVIVRVEGEAKAISGPATDLDHLIQQAAEAVFLTTQPHAYADWLRDHGRVVESLPIYRSLTVKGSAHDRAWAYLGWGDSMRILPGDDGGRFSMGRYREAARLAPDLWLVWDDIADIHQYVRQDSEAALAVRRRAVRAKDIGGADPNRAKFFQRRDQTYIDEFLGDFQHALQIETENADKQVDPALAYQAASLAAYEAAYLHDNALSQAWTERLVDRASTYDEVLKDRRVLRLAHWRLANVDDWSGAADNLAKANDGLPFTGSTAYYYALQATALARAGRLAEAKAISDQLPPRCYVCEVEAGVLANAAGDVPGAERAFAEAIRFGPSLPRAPLAAGEARLGRGDLDGAIAMFKLANARGPHYADPLEMWGEALVRKGDFAGAAAKFEEAEKYAPHWGRNHLRWGQALTRLGKADDANAQFRAAAPLALSAADRAQLPKV